MSSILSTIRLSILIAMAFPSTNWAEDCAQGSRDWIQTSPAHPKPDEVLRIKVISLKGSTDDVQLDLNGERSIPSPKNHEGPPWTGDTEIRMPDSRAIRIHAIRKGEEIACVEILKSEAVDRTTHEWTQANEAFYSAWIAQLFDGPPSQELSFKSLEPVLRDPDRNFLFNHLGLNEDLRLPANPDCADLPYFLRAYFAWKIGLPVASRACDRGTATRAPHCAGATIDDRFSGQILSASEFTQFSHKLFDTVHSGSARTAIQDESTDFFPLALTRESLWPGTVFADPYGHTLILVKWISQGSDQPGILLAADAQPDNSVTRKRFWEGNFLFADIPGAGPGFKAFRPILRDNGRLSMAGNEELANGAPFGVFSFEQAHLAADDFYAAMEKAINPDGLDPKSSYESKLNALVEQIGTRVKAIQNGDDYYRVHRGSPIPMPQGAAIFQTTGPWEDFASPSRDMRLIIALHVVQRIPDTIRRHPELFRLGTQTADDAARSIESYHQTRVASIEFTYPRSDGSPYSLKLSDLFDRIAALEVGYNPNDCAEQRWGAPPETEEYRTCNRRAPADQQARMTQYRSWFKNTLRPTR
jgi:hypothetical protein